MNDFEEWFKSNNTVVALVLIDSSRPTYSGLIKEVAKLAFEAGKNILMKDVPLKCAPCEYLMTPKPGGCMRGSGFDKYCILNEGLRSEQCKGCVWTEPNSGCNTEYDSDSCKRNRSFKAKTEERAVLNHTTIGNPATPASAGSDPKPGGLRVA